MTAKSKPWADTPFKLISASYGGIAGMNPNERLGYPKRFVWDMMGAHNIFIRGLNAIYNQAIKVGETGSEQDKKDFVAFAFTWVNGLHEHHHLEETTFFPDIEKAAGVPGLMEVNVKQHEAFTEGVDRFDEYLKSVQSGKEPYDGRKLVGIIDSFGATLAEHLSDEILTLQKLAEYPNADLEGVQKKFEKKLMEAVDAPEIKTKWVPFVLSNHEKMFEAGELRKFPAIPWFVSLILSWFYVPKFKPLWRFSSCTLSGERQELPFA